MIIVSQDETIILNFDNVSAITIDNIDIKRQIHARCNNDDDVILGEYATEERAKEVLQEIIEVLKNEEFFHIKKSSLNNLDELAEPKYILKPVSKPKVYEMPKE